MRTPDLLRVERHIRRLAGRAIGDFDLIRNNDRILVALSGGKDSWTLLHILSSLKERAPVSFSLIAVTVHPGVPRISDRNHGSVSRRKGLRPPGRPRPHSRYHARKLKPDDVPCSLCSRIRRGILYTQAQELGCRKVALGHHREDVIETLLLNQFYNGTIKAMAPCLRPTTAETS